MRALGMHMHLITFEAERTKSVIGRSSFNAGEFFSLAANPRSE